MWGRFLLRPLKLAPAFWRVVGLPWQPTDPLLGSPPTVTPWRPSSRKKNGPELSHSSLQSRTQGLLVLSYPKLLWVIGFVLLLLPLYMYFVTFPWPAQTSQSTFINGWRTLLIGPESCLSEICMLQADSSGPQNGVIFGDKAFNSN